MQDISHLKREMETLKKSYAKEQKDVDDLEKGGLQAFYLKIRGKYETAMDKELLEAGAAKVKFENKQLELENQLVDIVNQAK